MVIDGMKTHIVNQDARFQIQFVVISLFHKISFHFHQCTRLDCFHFQLFFQHSKTPTGYAEKLN